MIDKVNLKERLLNYMATVPKIKGYTPSYAVISGSTSVGVNQGRSDLDITGWTFPPVELLYPHIAGYIPGYGDPAPTHKPTWKGHNITDFDLCDAGKAEAVDLNFHSIMRYLTLAERNGVEVMASLFAGNNQVILCDPIASTVRRNRHMFISKEFGSNLRRRATQAEAQKKGGGKKRNCHDERKVNYLLFKDMYIVRSILSRHVVELTGPEIDHLRYIRTEGPIEIDLRAADRVINSIEDYKKRMKVPPQPDRDAIKELLWDCMIKFYGDIIGS